ncbi:DUF2332 domain-containing protein [Halorubellus sp. PRR65]|uniref:DUF2332 domain-containing protein n=1 Tax=Halorubellus sp. PRR65 TaxID=3098148 RepID=UPI002B25B785|nr:DUF2332 domain-containing protein [Halorubellus sp. PRR65]
MPADDDAAVAAEFDDLAGWCEDSSPLYERLCAIAATDAFLLDVAADHTPGQPAPQLLLAAIQAALFASDDADDPGTVDGSLAAYYPSVVDDARDPDDALADAVRAFVRTNETTVRDHVRSRRVQTNAVRRCSALYPGYATVAERVDAPLAILEVGSSAGLNLNWDRYRYAYRSEHEDAAGDDVREHVVGDADAPFTVTSDLRGDAVPPLPSDPPAVAGRVGVDVNPLDSTELVDARWLRSLVWPEHRDRRRVLDGALAVARDHPPDVVEGDAVIDLHAVADHLPADAPLVVAHSLVLYQFDDDAREAFHDAVAALAAKRDAPTYHLAGERPDPDRENGIQLRLARVDATDSRAVDATDSRAVETDSRAVDATDSRAVDATDSRAVDATDSRAVESEHLGTFEQHGAWVAWRDANDRTDAPENADGQAVVHEDV